MSHNLNSLKMGYIRDPSMGAITGDTMTLDHSSYSVGPPPTDCDRPRNSNCVGVPICS